MADLTKGVIIILSGGGFDEMNPVEVRDRMEDVITHVNNDPFVQASSNGQGLTFHLLPGQTTKHLHQEKWHEICAALQLIDATPLVVVGHSNGGAAAMSLARCLQAHGKNVDFMFTCDSVLTFDDLGDVNEVPANVVHNLNSYVRPTPAWLLAPFPIGRSNKRETDGSLTGIVNVGLKYELPGALAHRNAFYDLAGGDKTGPATYTYPLLIQESILAALQGATIDQLATDATASLTILGTTEHFKIKISTLNSTVTVGS